MKNRLYMKPEMAVVRLALEGIICDSYHELPIGGSGNNFAAPEVRRRSAWDEYESQY